MAPLVNNKNHAYIPFPALFVDAFDLSTGFIFVSFQKKIDIILEVFDRNLLSVQVDFDPLNRSSHIESTSEKIKIYEFITIVLRVIDDF